MTRRNASSRLARPTGRMTAGLVAATLAVGWLVSPVAADEEIVINPGQVVVADPGSLVTISSELVPKDLVGLECDLRLVAENGSSIHPGNSVIVTTGDSRSVVEEAEDKADGELVDIHRVVLGESILIELEMGPDGLSSMGFTVGFECTTLVEPTVAPLIETSAPSTAPPTTATPTTAAPPVTPAPTTAAPTTAPPTTTPPTTAALQVPTVLPAKQEAPPLPKSPPARATTGNPTFTG